MRCPESLLFGCLFALSCTKTPPEPVSQYGESTPSTPTEKQPAPPAAPERTADPLAGKWTLSDAVADLPKAGTLIASIETSLGTMKCKLYEDEAPVTVANFVGLARGTRPWKNAAGQWLSTPAYDNTTFHRIIKGFMIQGGDQRGDGSGEPGYVIKDELWPGAKHDRAGLLCMANRGPNTNGAQFFITHAAAKHLDSSYTIFGECSGQKDGKSVLDAIAEVPLRGESPITPVKILHVTVARETGK